MTNLSSYPFLVLPETFIPIPRACGYVGKDAFVLLNFVNISRIRLFRQGCDQNLFVTARLTVIWHRADLRSVFCVLKHKQKQISNRFFTSSGITTRSRRRFLKGCRQPAAPSLSVRGPRRSGCTCSIDIYMGPARSLPIERFQKLCIRP